MGFMSGFTGGVTLTLSLAYLFTYTHQANRISQSNILRSSTHALNTARSPVPPPPPPSRQQAAAIERQTITERFKDWWNSELEGAVRSLQHTDWNASRDSLEASAMRLIRGPDWKPEFSPEAWAQANKTSITAPLTGRQLEQPQHQNQQQQQQPTSEEPSHTIADQARAAYSNARQKAGELAGQAREGMESAKQKVETATATAKAKVHMAEEKWESRAEQKILHMSDVERALQQRYEPRRIQSAAMGQSVDEALEGRYRGIGEKDYSQLRGI